MVCNDVEKNLPLRKYLCVDDNAVVREPFENESEMFHWKRAGNKEAIDIYTVHVITDP